MIFIGIVLSQICWSAEHEYHNLKFDIEYMFKWTADRMDIQIDIKKQMPKVASASSQYIQEAVEKKYGLKKRYELYEGTIIIDIQYQGFYCPEEKTIYVRNDLNPEEDGPIERWIVHEIVHYIQHQYFGFFQNSRERESQAKHLAEIFCAEHKIKKAR